MRRTTNRIQVVLRLLAVTVLSLCIAGGAVSAIASQPTVGSAAPNFTLDTLDGKSVSLDSFTAESPVVLLVLRGWPGYQCPLCTKQVHKFVERAKVFRKRGARIVMIYPGPADQLQAHAQEFLADKSWPTDFVFLVDPAFVFTVAYGLRWEAADETAFPSMFVIERGGQIVFAKISKDHGGRGTPEEALAALP